MSGMSPGLKSSYQQAPGASRAGGVETVEFTNSLNGVIPYVCFVTILTLDSNYEQIPIFHRLIFAPYGPVLSYYDLRMRLDFNLP
jgi:hypothetical protein